MKHTDDDSTDSKENKHPRTKQTPWGMIWKHTEWNAGQCPEHKARCYASAYPAFLHQKPLRLLFASIIPPSPEYPLYIYHPLTIIHGHSEYI